MNVKGIEGLSVEQVMEEVRRGGRFVIYQYCVSVAIMSFRRSSMIHFLRSGDSGKRKGLPYTLLSLLAGWWGIPWGPIWTVQTIVNNSRGGKDVTQEMMALFESALPTQAEPAPASHQPAGPAAGR
ncbi:MAG TPA: hypothetical protein VMP67_09320 [Candidatus Limnocylindria bacterium]|nr:hypothetical protein [Candidatus Limnocylindria bacterium]